MARTIPQRENRKWSELTDAQRAGILAKTLPGWHPANLPNSERDAARITWCVRKDDPASLDLGAVIGGLR
jgi:hypothetical protein